MSGWFTTFMNCRLARGGTLVEDQFVVSDDTGEILYRTGYIGGEAVDLEEAIIAPGFLELQTNGLLGFHFTHFENDQQYQAEIDKVSKYLVTQGVTGFYATIPTVSGDDFKKILKLVTLAPELEASTELVKGLTSKGIKVSLGHSTAISARTTDPEVQSPYYSIIADGHHLHPSVASMLYKANPHKCVLITDSIELAGLPDGVYPGHAQIPHQQRKIGSRVVIDGTDTLVGGCASLQECVQNLMRWTGCDVAQAVQCVTENVADLMGDRTRGSWKVGGGRILSC
ncbi:hypothetical protein H2203_008477 [Taxawa tesnikishii (nom. ined.)]|nr:hypothetical protein H2203_008477 [Dothideales sp. JES 119]